MARILVIGGTGYLGGLLVPALSNAAHEVTVLSLEQPVLATRAHHVLGSRHDVELLQRLSREAAFDGIVDLIAFHESDVATVVEIWQRAPHRLRRYVLLSTLAAVSGFRSSWATEDSAFIVDGPDEDYASGKACCERVLLSAAWQGFPGVVLRAAPVFGPGDAVSRENYVVQRLLLGMPIPCVSAPKAIVVRVFASDLIQAIANCFSRPLPAGRVFHLVQRENVTFEYYVQCIAASLGCNYRLQQLPPETVEHAGLNPAALPFGGTEPTMRFSIERAVAELGFRPTPFQTALQQTLATIQSEGAFEHPAWPGRSSAQSCLAGTQQHLQLEAEKALWNGVHGSPLEDDELLGALFESGSCAAVPFQDWPALAPLETPQEPTNAVILPDSVRDWLPPNSVAMRSNQRPFLQAAIEPSHGARECTFLLYTRALLHRARGYAFANSPITLRLYRFRDLASAAPARVNERIIVAIHDPTDADALVEWLEQCERQQAVLAPDCSALARVYLVDSVAWVALSGGTGWQAELRGSIAQRNPRLGEWCAVFAACRRLRRRAEHGSQTAPLRLTRHQLCE